MRVYLVIVLAMVVIGAAIIGVWAGMRDEPVIQPIAFSHSLHVGNAGLKCLDCHTEARSAVHAGLPMKGVCFDCHDIDDILENEGQQPELDRLAAFAELDGDIPWRRVALTRPDVFFSHRRHTAAAELDCLVCHTNQSSLTRPPRSAELVMMMDDCIACHHTQQASVDCLACHR